MNAQKCCGADKKVIGIVGMPGSGKSVASEVAKTFEFEIVVMGDVVREVVRERGWELTPENLGRVMLELREGDPAIVAKRCMKKIAEIEHARIVIEGIRSLAEVDEFKRYFPQFKLLSISSSPETRFRRLFQRKRSDDSKNRTVFEERDQRELGVGIDSALVAADYTIINEGTINQFKTSMSKFFEEYLRE